MFKIVVGLLMDVMAKILIECNNIISFRFCLIHPENIKQLYLESLFFLGIDGKNNDIRFVEDDWESPTLGAWGLGWEVWCNGMEITQFTYFQQVGGLDCNPISGEITYGLERLALFIQKKESIFDLD